MVSIKFLFFFALAIACVFAFPAEESTRAKKQVLLGSYPYGYSAYAGAPVAAAAPLAYSAGYAAAPYSAYPYGYSSYYY